MGTSRSCAAIICFVFVLSSSIPAFGQDTQDDGSSLYNEIAVGVPSEDVSDEAEISGEREENLQSEAPAEELQLEAMPKELQSETPPQEPEWEPLPAEFKSKSQTEDLQSKAPPKELKSESSPDEQLSAAVDHKRQYEFGMVRHYNNLFGSTGLLHATEAGSTKSGTFGVGLKGSFFRFADYLYYGDEHTNMRGRINLHVTPLDFLEIFADLSSEANQNNVVIPELAQSLGAFAFGVKGFTSLNEWFSFGGLLGLDFANPLGKVGFSFQGMNLLFGLLSTFNFMEFNKKLPLRAHLNLSYRVDQTAKLVEDVEKRQGGCGGDADSDGIIDYGGCLTPFQRKALSIDRLDNFNIGIGIEAAWPYVSPLVEYWLEIPVNRQDFTCPNVENQPDSCLGEQGIVGMRQWVTLGVRLLPAIEMLAIDLGIDIGLTGWAPSVHELAPQDPYRIMFGASYNFDPFAQFEKKVVAPPSSVPPVVPDVVVVGTVHDEKSKESVIKGASVTYLSEESNPQLSDVKGRFRSYALSPGIQKIRVEAPGYVERVFEVDIPFPSDRSATGQQVIEVPLDCPLIRDTQTDNQAQIVLKITDGEGNPLTGATIKLEGPSSDKVVSGEDGVVERDVEPGSYSLRVEKPGYLKKVRRLDATVETRSEVEVQLRPKPEQPSVAIEEERIAVNKKIHFATDSDELMPDSLVLLDEVADVIISHSEIEIVEIQGHSDNRGNKRYNTELSRRRAEAVLDYLKSLGVEEQRLKAKGFGPTKPIAPNITAKGRARNRRVEFHILKRADTNN